MYHVFCAFCNTHVCCTKEGEGGNYTKKRKKECIRVGSNCVNMSPPFIGYVVNRLESYPYNIHIRMSIRFQCACTA